MDFFAEVGVTEAGSGVSSWVDGKSAFDGVQAADGNRPTLEPTGMGGRPTVTNVRANNDQVRIVTGPAFLSTAAKVIIAAVDVVTTQTIDYLIDLLGSPGGVRLIAQLGSTVNLGYFRTAHRNLSAMVSGPQVLRWVFPGDGSSMELFRDGTSLATDALAAAAIGAAAVGIGGDNSSVSAAPADVRIGRLMFLDTEDATRDALIETWMADHYGI